MAVVKCFAFCLACLALLALTFSAAAQEPQPLYPAIQGYLWGYIDSSNQWMLPPYSHEQLSPVYDNEFLFDYATDEWLDMQGRRYTMDEMIDPARWGLTELNGQPVYWCKSQRFGQIWLISCYAEGEENSAAPMGYILVDDALNRMNDQPYNHFILSEDNCHAIVTLEENADIGILIDDQGRVLREDVPIGILSEDGLVVSRYENDERLDFDAATGMPLDDLQAAALHAAHSPEGLWPCEMEEPQETVQVENETMDWSWSFPAAKETFAYTVYVDADGNIAEHLGRFLYASRFRQGFAMVETEEGDRKIIDTLGNTVLADVEAVNHSKYGDPEMQDAWALVKLCDPDRLVFVGYNYLNAAGKLLFPDCHFRWAEEFFQGRALVQVMLPDYSLAYAHIDPTGRIVWAEDGVDVVALQAQLNRGVCPDPADMTADDVTKLLLGEWSTTGGGEFLTEIRHEDGSWSAALMLDGTWYVSETKPGDRFYHYCDYVFVEVSGDECGYQYTTEVGLNIYHRDAFGVSWGEGGSGYVRYKTRYEENWCLMQRQKQRNEAYE